MIVFNLRIFEACRLDGFVPTLSIPSDEDDETIMTMKTMMVM